MDYAASYANCQWVDFSILDGFMQDCLKAAGIPQDDARLVAEILLESDRRGIDSHGIGRLKPIYIDRIDWGILNPKTRIDIVKETETTAVLDGNNGMGHVIAHKAMSMAIEKARSKGIAMTAVRNSTHYGIAGYYASMATKEGMIGITGTNARPSIAPTFGVENMLGTNPLTIGLPTDEEFDFILDCATSVSQRGKIEMYSRAGKSLPPGWVIDRQGHSRSDTDQILVDLTKGLAALAPLGGLGEDTAGYKGYGYAVVVEVLSAALQDGAYLKALKGSDAQGNRIPYPLGHFFIAVNPEAFMGQDLFREVAGKIMRDLRNSQKAPGQERIYTAGEKEHIARQYREAHGCPVPPSLQKVLSGLKDRFKLSHSFPWD